MFTPVLCHCKHNNPITKLYNLMYRDSAYCVVCTVYVLLQFKKLVTEFHMLSLFIYIKVYNAKHKHNFI